jgi:hypothetical protein
VWRGANVGIIFQFFQLLPTLSALENAVLPLDCLRRGSKRERFERARRDLELVGLGACFANATSAQVEAIDLLLICRLGGKRWQPVAQDRVVRAFEPSTPRSFASGCDRRAP